MTANTTDPHDFWELEPGHPISDGHPHDEYIGDYHILFSKMWHDVTQEYAPSYEIHDSNHTCIAHMHDKETAKLLCTMLSIKDRIVSDGR